MINNLKSQIYRYYGRLFKKSNVDSAEAAIFQFEALDDKEKEKVRTEKLLVILKRAYLEVPYYRELFDQANLKFTDAKSLDNFGKIPILTKKIIRNNFEKITNTHINEFQWYKSNTSGSTGSPLIFIIDQGYDDIKKALRNYQIRVNGKKSADTVIKLWGFYRDDDKPKSEIKHRIANWLQNRIDLNSIYLTDSIMASFVRTIMSKRSVFMEAYSQSAYQLAKYMNRNSIVIENVSAVITSASTLFDFMREEIEKAFKCPVYNRYGAQEASTIAFEKDQNSGLFISKSQYICEIINENGQYCKPGEEGDVVITNFSNFAFPFIRYRIGDRAVVKEIETIPVKSCVSFENLVGRITDVFIKADGSSVNSHYFGHMIGMSVISGWIDKIQVVQVDYKKIQINIVKFDQRPTPEDEIQQMRKTVKRIMGEDCQVDFNFVDDLVTTQSGKHQYVKSLINKNEIPSDPI
jgi:phenylacetate-CoA ligase